MEFALFELYFEVSLVQLFEYLFYALYVVLQFSSYIDQDIVEIGNDENVKVLSKRIIDHLLTGCWYVGESE